MVLVALPDYAHMNSGCSAAWVAGSGLHAGVDTTCVEAQQHPSSLHTHTHPTQSPCISTIVA